MGLMKIMRGMVMQRAQSSPYTDGHVSFRINPPPPLPLILPPSSNPFSPPLPPRPPSYGSFVQVSAPGKTPVRLRGKKPVVVSVINADLFASSTLNAMGIDGVMTPSNM